MQVKSLFTFNNIYSPFLLICELIIFDLTFFFYFCPKNDFNEELKLFLLDCIFTRSVKLEHLRKSFQIQFENRKFLKKSNFLGKSKRY